MIALLNKMSSLVSTFYRTQVRLLRPSFQVSSRRGPFNIYYVMTSFFILILCVFGVRVLYGREHIR